MKVDVEQEEEDELARQASYDKRGQFRFRESRIGCNSDVEFIRTSVHV